MKKRELILVIMVIAFGVIYNSIKSGHIRFGSNDLRDKKNPVDFPQKELQYTYKESDTGTASVRQIKINNPAGDIEVAKATDNIIRITPVIRVFHKDKGKAQDIAKDIRLLSRETGDKIAIDVDNNENFPYERVRLVFKCLIPANIELDLKNRYGNIDINDAGKNIIIDERHGDLFIKNVTASLKIKNKNGLVRLYDINGNIDLDTNHSQVKIKNTSALKLQCGHTDFYAADIKEGINITYAGYSDLIIENTGRLNIDAKHTKMKLVNIKNGIVITNSHAPISLSDIEGDVDIKARQCRISVNKVTGELLRIDDSYSDVDIDGFSGKTMDVQLKHCELIAAFANITEKISIKTNYTEVVLKYPGTINPSFNILSKNGKIIDETPARFNITKEREKQSLITTGGMPQIIIETEYANVILKNIAGIAGNLPAEAE